MKNIYCVSLKRLDFTLICKTYKQSCKYLSKIKNISYYILMTFEKFHLKVVDSKLIVSKFKSLLETEYERNDTFYNFMESLWKNVNL